ncbi:MAG: helix-turn-helix transcriptional regulator [Nitrospira sp.]|nr:helix-turn-helix transcriptional regulator [Nitrospira sp.]
MQKSISTKEYRIFLAHLREAREAAGVTQVELAGRLKDTQTFISKCERGERRIDLIEFLHWCAALGISASAFLQNLELDFQPRRRGHSKK